MAKREELSELEAVVKRLRRLDYASYLSVRLSPKETRDELYWLYGFFHEVAQIPFKSDEPLLGEIRLQWWRDSLVKLERGERVGHPVADGLGDCLAGRGPLLRGAMTGIIDSFRFDVQKTPVPDMATFFEIQDQRYGGLLRAALLITECSTPQTVLLASEAGMSIGVTAAIAQLPLTLRAGMQPLPVDMLSAHGLTHQDFMTSEAPSPEIAVRIGKALYAIADGGVVISWDIKARLGTVKKKQRVYFSCWMIVPALLKTAIEDRRLARPIISSLNPLRIYMTLLRGTV